MNKVNTIFVSRRRGQLLVEVILSVGLIALLVAAVVPLVLSSTKAMRDQTKVSQAALLGRETLDAAKAIKEEDWNSIYLPLGTNNKGSANLYHTVISSDKWQLATGEENINLAGVNFTRHLIIENVSRTGSNGVGDIEAVYHGLRDDPSTQRLTVTVDGFGGSPLVLVEYVSRWNNQTLSETDWSAGQESSQTDIDTATAGVLMLASSGGGSGGTYGNKTLLTATGTIGGLNSSAKRASMRFTAQKSGTVNNLSFYINTMAGSTSTINYRVGLQEDNNGLPSGTYLSSTTSAFSGVVGWRAVTIPATDLVSGTAYHLVVQYASGNTPNNKNNIDIRSSVPQNKLVSLNGAGDLNQNTLFYNGTSWANQNRQPVYRLGFSDGSYEGNPYDSSQVRSIYGTNFEGEKFTISGEKVVNSLSLYLAKNAPQIPADDLYFSLKDLTTNVDLVNNEIFVHRADVSTTYAWLTYTFVSPLTLTDGHQYRLMFSSPAAKSGRCYSIFNVSTPGSSGYQDISWDGVNSVVSRSTNSGSSWTETDYIDLSGYYFSMGGNSTYSLTGDLTSKTFDLTKSSGFNRISWNNLNLPAGTNVKFQLAANNDGSTWNFLGPDGTAGTFYTNNVSENISSVLNNNRYLRYKVFLETNNNLITPVLADVTISYSL